MKSSRNRRLLPIPYNTRSKDMWKHIDKYVDFDGRSVIDVGCGRGDLSMMSWISGATVVYGVDNSAIELIEASMRASELLKAGANIRFVRMNIENWNSDWPGKYDIAICTSVLPYVLDPDKLLSDIYRDSGIAIIECQYAGDGPGLEYIKDDDDMVHWLSKFRWKEIQMLGTTTVESRDMKRSIWLCTK